MRERIRVLTSTCASQHRRCSSSYASLQSSSSTKLEDPHLGRSSIMMPCHPAIPIVPTWTIRKTSGLLDPGSLSAPVEARRQAVVDMPTFIHNCLCPTVHDRVSWQAPGRTSRGPPALSTACYIGKLCTGWWTRISKRASAPDIRVVNEDKGFHSYYLQAVIHHHARYLRSSLHVQYVALRVKGTRAKFRRPIALSNEITRLTRARLTSRPKQ